MAYITIPQLPAGSALTGLEVFESVQSSTSVKLTANQMKSFVTANPTLTVADAATNTVSTAATLTHTTTSTPVAGFGTGLTFQSENDSGSLVNGTALQSIETDPTATLEFFDFAIRSIVGGTQTEVARFTSAFRLGVGIANPAATLHGVAQDLNVSGVTAVLRADHTTISGTSGNGIGSAIEFAVENNAGATKVGASVDAIAVDVSAGVEDFDMVFNLMKMRVSHTGNVGIGTAVPNSRLEVFLEDGNNANAVAVARFTHASTPSAPPAVGIGTGVEFVTETSANNYEIGGSIYTESGSVASTNERFDMNFALMKGGVPNIEVMTLSSNDTSTGTLQTGARLGVNTGAPVRVFQAVANDGVNAGITSLARLTHTTTGTPGNGIGAGVEFEVQTSSSPSTNLEIGARIDAVATDVNLGAEDFDLVFSSMQNGAPVSEMLRMGSTITPAIPFSQLGVGVTPSAASRILVDASSLTISPMKFNPTGAQLLTTPQTGAIEYDQESLYFTPASAAAISGAADGRGLINSQMTYVQSQNTKVGPNAVNTAQAATFSTATVNITVTTAPGSVIGKTGALVTFTAATMPANIVANQPYFVNYVNATTITISATPNGAPIQATSTGTTVVAVFHFTPFGTGVDTLYLPLIAGNRYWFDLGWTVSHTGATATAVALSALSVGGSIGQLSYTVESSASTAAITGNLTGVAGTQSTITNFITTNFPVQTVVTAATAATANTTNWQRVTGFLDVSTNIDYFTFGYGFNAAPTASTVILGAYWKMWSMPIALNNTLVGNFRTN